jgi:hypothetical protein
MSRLSLSTAWDETKGVIARDGRLLASVALAMIVLPAALTGVLNPRGMADPSRPLSIDLVVLLASLVALAGQLALIRLALSPSVTVGGAIAHGLRRMPIYLVSAILIGCLLILAAVPLIMVLAASGVPLETAALLSSPVFYLLAVLYFALLFFVGVRMLMSSPAATAEPIGPIAIIKRSWQLTAGNAGRLFLFLVLFFIAALVVVLAVAGATGVVVNLLLGPAEPMSASALVIALVQAVIQAAATTLLAVMLARIYVQLSGRSEAMASVPTTGT